MPHPEDRRGPVERAISARDMDALYAALHERTEIDSETGCWRYRGNLRPSGYGMVGYGPTNHLVHRLSAWAHASFPGELKAFPNVAHGCGQKECWNPLHVFPVSSIMNSLEALLRRHIRIRIAALESAVLEMDATHPVLSQFPALEDTPGLQPPQHFDSPAETRRKSEAALRLEEKRRLNREHRFEQIAAVLRLRAEGVIWRIALAEVGISKRVFTKWHALYLEHINDQDAAA